MAESSSAMDQSSQGGSTVEMETGAENPFAELAETKEGSGDGDSGIGEGAGDAAAVGRLLASVLGGPALALPAAALDSQPLLEDHVQALLLQRLLETTAAPASDDSWATEQGPMGDSLRLAEGTPELAMWALLLRSHAAVCREAAEASLEVESRVLRQLRVAVVSQLALLLSGHLTGSRDVARWLLLRGLVREELSTALLDDLASLSQTHLEDFTAIFTDVAEGLSMWGNLLTLTDDKFRLPLRLLAALCELKVPGTKLRPFASLLVKHRLWLGARSGVKGEGRELGRTALLGPFLSLSVFVEDGAGTTAAYYFPDGCTDESAAFAFPPLRNRLQLLAGDLHRVFHAVLVNADSRQPALHFFAAALGVNERKAQMQTDDTLVSSDAFALNLLSVLYLLSEKIALDKVNPLYPFHPSARVVIAEQARLVMDAAEAEAFGKALADKGAGEVNFVSECLFLCVHAQRLGLNPALSRHSNRLRAIGDYKRHLAKLEASPNAATNPAMQAKVRAAKATLAKLERMKWCGEAWLSDAGLLSRGLSFCAKQLRLISNLLKGQHDQPIPAPDQTPEVFKAVPQFYLEDPLDLLITLERSQPQVLLEAAETQELLPLVITMVCASGNVKSPFLAAKAIEFLYYLSPRAQPANERLWESATQVAVLPPFRPRSLFLALQRFYFECEMTGSHTEFFDKFNFRYHVQVLFSCLWRSPVHRGLMLDEFRECGSDFVKFVSMVINDCTFLLDESLGALTTINEVEAQMERPAEWDGLSGEEQRERRSLLSQNQGMARSYLQLTRETLSMFNYMTLDLQEPFLNPLLGKRLAAMLNYNMAVLCGPKAKSLRVKEAARYGWEPRAVLEQLTSVYLHLASAENARVFAEHIAADERSYSAPMWAGVVERLGKSSIVPAHQVERMKALGEAAAEVAAANAQMEEDWGEVPDEFADPIMGTLMRQPVRLPSGHVVDREVILRHLLSAGNNNPFNRDVLTEDQLAPATDLKDRIDAWVLEKRTQAKS